MKRLSTWSIILFLPALVLGAALSNTRAAASPPPPRLPRVLEPSVPSRTEDTPIHMPNLIGHTLEYATGIWDDDEPLPTFLIKRLSTDANAVVVQQRPAPGTLIIPQDSTITLTLGKPTAAPDSSNVAAPDSFASVTAAAGQATLLRSPYLQNLTASSATIVWTTVEDGPSEVRYGVSDFAQSTAASSIATTTPAPAPYDKYYFHQATLTNLAPNTTYQYKIYSNGADLTPGGAGKVRAALPPSTPFRFAVIGDSGDGSQNQKDVATRLLQVKPDLVVHTGDIIYSEATYDGFETKYFQAYKDLLENVWLAPAIGNHDLTYNNGKSFADVFVNPPNGSSDAVQRELYYSFDYGNAHFVMLDNFLSFSPGSAQYTWLQNDLARTGQFWKFVVFHVPAYSSDKYQQPKDNANEVKYLAPLFEQYGVNVVLTGHWHNYERMKPLRGGQVSTIAAGGVVYLVTGGGGAGLAGIGTGTLNPRTDAKVQAFHLTMFDINGCSLQLAAVRKVSSASDTFDQSDIFDSYTIDRCGGTPSTSTPTSTPTNTPTAGPSATPTNTPTASPTAAPTNTAAPSSTPTSTPVGAPTATATATAGSPWSKNITFEDGALMNSSSGVDSQPSGTVTLETSAGHPLHGSYSAHVGGTSIAYLQQSFPAADDVFASFVVRLTALPGAAVRLAMFSNSGTTVGNLQLGTDGRLQLRNNSTTLGSASAPLTAGVTYRVGLHQRRGTSGNAILEAYLAPDDGSPLAMFASIGNGAWTSTADRFRFGATTGALDALFDDIKIDTAALP